MSEDELSTLGWNLGRNFWIFSEITAHIWTVEYWANYHFWWNSMPLLTHSSIIAYADIHYFLTQWFQRMSYAHLLSNSQQNFLLHWTHVFWCPTHHHRATPTVVLWGRGPRGVLHQMFGNQVLHMITNWTQLVLRFCKNWGIKNIYNQCKMGSIGSKIRTKFTMDTNKT